MYDVVVIGGGLAGLQTALSIQRQGLSVVVLEARPRVGGKTWSVPLASGRGNSDVGAAWVNDRKQKRIWRYATKFGLEVVEQRTVGKAIMQLSDDERFETTFGSIPDFDDKEKRDLERVRDHILAESLKPGPPRPEDDAVSLDEYVRKLGALPKTIKMANLWTQVMHGVESKEESAAFFIDYCRTNGGFNTVRSDDSSGGNYLRFPQGTQSIAKGIAMLLGSSNIRLSSPVSAITQHDGIVQVTTKTGARFQGRKCVLAIPSLMYQTLEIRPPLPTRLQQITNSSILGDYTKVIVCYDRPWWRDQGHNGFFMSFCGPVSSARDTSVDQDRNFALTCFVNGQFGRDWNKLDVHARRAAVIKQIARVYGAGPESEAYRPIEVFEQIWMHEEYSQGALTPIHALGHYTGYTDVYGKPVEHLHFVGTEYAKEWKGYMEGALCSGEQGAAEVVAALGSDARAKL